MSFVGRDVENDAGAQEELLRLGFHSLPVTVIGDRMVHGFNPNQLAEALHFGIKIVPRDPSETLSIIERAIIAVERAVRQMPNDKLNWSVSGRERPMRALAHHIFMHIQGTMSEPGAAVVSFKSEAAAQAFASFKDIADYGRNIIEEYCVWAAGQDLEALRKPPVSDSNTKSGAERLDITAGQIIQHLRQLYDVLEGFGITPEQRVPDSEWPSEYVLSILW